MKKIALVLLAMAMAGCAGTPKPKLLETANPKGYKCSVHGEGERAYKIGFKYYCKQCVDDNIGQVELIVGHE